MAEPASILVGLLVLVPILGATLTALARSSRQADGVARVAAGATAAVALALAVIALARTGQAPLRGRWYLLDNAGALFLGVSGVIGLASVLVSPAYLRSSGRSWLSATASHRWYYAALFAFWAALLAVPIAANLAVALLLIEATTAASALLVAFSGARDALEAGWKYLVLTTLGLSVALLGMVVVAIAQANLGHHGLHALDWRAINSAAGRMGHEQALIAFVLLLTGLATKAGWAPVHNWLPDAHSEAPPPVSAMLSAALLPTVILLTWRARTALDPAIAHATTSAVLIGFGLISIVVAVPFLWRALPWKRLLAYSSLEHMGVIALGIGFGSPLAIAGVVVHVAGHALAKALGFYASQPLLRIDRSLARRPPDGVAAKSPATATAMGVSLWLLAALPPSPLFVSEIMILLGGIEAGYIAVSAIALVALALAFLGLAHALLEGVIGEPAAHRRRARHRGERSIARLTGGVAGASIALAAAAVALPGSLLVAELMRGVQ